MGPDWQQGGVERRGHEREVLEVELAGVHRCWVVENKAEEGTKAGARVCSLLGQRVREGPNQRMQGEVGWGCGPSWPPGAGTVQQALRHWSWSCRYRQEPLTVWLRSLTTA